MATVIDLRALEENAPAGVAPVWADVWLFFDAGIDLAQRKPARAELREVSERIRKELVRVYDENDRLRCEVLALSQGVAPAAPPTATDAAWQRFWAS